MEGKGTVDPPVEPPDVALGVTAAGVNPDGVDACSVANRSGVGEEAMGRLHPMDNRISITGNKRLSLLIIKFNGLKKEFFTR